MEINFSQIENFEEERKQAKAYWAKQDKQRLTYWVEPHAIEGIAEIMEVIGASSVFEFGCAAGRNLDFLKKRFNNSTKKPFIFRGIDVNPSAVDFGRLNFGLDILLGDEQLINDEKLNSFDLVFTVSVLDHIPTPQKALEALMGISKRYGVFIEPSFPASIVGSEKVSTISTRWSRRRDNIANPFTYFHDYSALFEASNCKVVMSVSMPTHLNRVGPFYNLWLVEKKAAKANIDCPDICDVNELSQRIICSSMLLLLSNIQNIQDNAMKRSDLSSKIEKKNKILNENLKNAQLVISKIETENKRLNSARSNLEEQIQCLTKKLSVSNKAILHKKATIDRLKNSVDYQLGYHMKSAVTSLRGFVRLPLAIWRIYKDALKRRKIARDKKKQQQATIDPICSSIKRPSPPLVREDVSRAKDLQLRGMTKGLKVASILDEFSYNAFKFECHLCQLQPNNWMGELDSFKPEMLLVESAWRGKGGLWSHKIAHKSAELEGIIQWCQQHSVPTIFWNKEDPSNFQLFLNTAKLFDYVFTTDLDCVLDYKSSLKHERVYFLPFACQPAIHNPIELYQRKDAISFAGSYYNVRYLERAKDLRAFLDVLPDFKPVDIYDRNYNKQNSNYQFPEKYHSFIVGTLSFNDIDQAYKGYRYAINVNSIKQSQTMFARRIFELLASNTLAVSNFSRGLRLMMGDLVVTSDKPSQILSRLQKVKVADDYELEGKLKLAALRKVMLEHTYQKRLHYVCSKVKGVAQPKDTLPMIAVLGKATTKEEVDKLVHQFHAQTHQYKRLILVVSGDAKCVEDKNIDCLTDKQASNKTVKEAIGEAPWVASLSSEDYYGPNYLLDIALATRYSCAELIGKASYFIEDAGEIKLLHAQAAYAPVDILSARQSAFKANDKEVSENLKTWLDTFLDKWLAREHTLAIDPYNYCRHATDQQQACIEQRVNDFSNLDVGLSIDQLQAWAERIILTKNAVATQRVILSPIQLADLFSFSQSNDVNLALSHTTLTVTSRLADGKHTYLYAASDFQPEMLTDGRTIKCYLDTTSGLAVSLVVLFLDKQKQRISHAIFQANQNIEIDIPSETAWFRLGLRVLSSGKTDIKGLMLGSRDLQSIKVIGKGDNVLLTDRYPNYHDPDMSPSLRDFIKIYEEKDLRMDVFQLCINQPLIFDEFEGVDVVAGDLKVLDQMLLSNTYKHVLAHCFGPNIWEVLKNHIERIKVTVWVDDEKVQALDCHEPHDKTNKNESFGYSNGNYLIDFWRGILQAVPDNMVFVFESNSCYEKMESYLDLCLLEKKINIIGH